MTMFLFFFSIVLASSVFFCAWRWRQYRGQLLWGAVFTIPVIIANIVVAGSLNRLGVSAVDATRTVTQMILGALSTGALLAMLYEATINRWLTPVTYSGRHRLRWLIIGMVVTAAMVLMGVPLMLAVVVGLLINSGLVIMLDRWLFWDIIVGALGFAVWFFIADALFGIRASGDINHLLLGARPLGFTVAGLALERVVAMAGIGALLSPLFVALKRQRMPDHPIGETTSSLKMASATVMVVLCAALAFWFSWHYVQAPRVQTLTPAVGATAVLTTSEITLHFSRPVDRDSIVLEIEPAVNGSWRFTEPAFGDHAYRSATFTPDDPLTAGTTYHGQVVGIRSVWGIAGDAQSIGFTTEVAVLPPTTEVTPEPTPVVVTPPEPVVDIPVPVPVVEAPAPAPVVVTVASHQTLLPVAVDYQDRPLSCEAAALKMALANKGVKVTESDIMKIVGYDPTPHRNGVWGDPNQAFVGNIDGKQNTTGYGVYWDPIARAAKHWRSARAITNGTMQDLTAALDEKQAVVIWGTIGKAYRETWKTTSGKTISAWKGEHARTLIGYVGTPDKPTKFIINDPVAGRLNWSTATFLANWGTFNNSAVVVE